MFSEAIVQKIKFVAEISNSDIVHNAQCFLSRKKSEEDTCYKLWADVDNELLQNKKLKFSYYLFLVQKTKFLLDDI